MKEIEEKHKQANCPFKEVWLQEGQSNSKMFNPHKGQICPNCKEYPEILQKTLSINNPPPKG